MLAKLLYSMLNSCFNLWKTQNLTMIKRRTASKILDKMHKGVVLTCVGITIYGSYLLGMRFYRYFSVLRPQQKQIELQLQKELLNEGKNIGDSIQDYAPKLTT